MRRAARTARVQRRAAGAARAAVERDDRPGAGDAGRGEGRASCSPSRATSRSRRTCGGRPSASARGWASCRVIVNSAGTNIVRRALAELSVEDFRHVVDVNLTGAFLVTHAFLPDMRKAGRGTIVNIVSDAGRDGEPDQRRGVRRGEVRADRADRDDQHGGASTTASAPARSYPARSTRRCSTAARPRRRRRRGRRC